MEKSVTPSAASMKENTDGAPRAPMGLVPQIGPGIIALLQGQKSKLTKVLSAQMVAQTKGPVIIGAILKIPGTTVLQITDLHRHWCGNTLPMFHLPITNRLV